MNRYFAPDVEAAKRRASWGHHRCRREACDRHRLDHRAVQLRAAAGGPNDGVSDHEDNLAHGTVEMAITIDIVNFIIPGFTVPSVTASPNLEQSPPKLRKS